MLKKTVLLPCLFIFMLIAAGVCAADEADIYSVSLQNGHDLYQNRQWQEAAIEFRRAQETTSDDDQWAEAIYWVILSELAYNDFGSAVRDMNELERRSPYSIYARDMAYHKAMIYYNQGYYENAFVSFFDYLKTVQNSEDSETRNKAAAAYYWIGESLYSMRHFDEAEKFYLWVINYYPESPKKEACLFRLELIKQKKIETMLLELLQQSHIETLRSSEENRRLLGAYEQQLIDLQNEFQRQLNELRGSTAAPIIQPPPPEAENIPIENVHEEEQVEDIPEREIDINWERAAQIREELGRLIQEIQNREGY